MRSSKAIVVLIGNNGTLISTFNNQVKCEFFESLTNDNKKNIAEIFIKNPKLPTYILLDNSEQTYKKKNFPNIRKADIARIAKRELSQDTDKESFKNFVIIKNAKKNKALQKNLSQYECLFINSVKTENIDDWLNFLYEMPNRLVGVYMLPLEAFNFAKKIVSIFGAKQSHSNNLVDKIFCLIIHTKSNGLRQIVFSGTGIVFTRVINYNFEDPHFIDKYHQDIYSTFEYLKRIYIDLTNQNFEVINISSEKINKIIENIKNDELKISIYSTQEINSKLKLDKTDIDDCYLDLAISSIFLKSKKILNFPTPKIKLTEKFIFFQTFCHVFNFLLLEAFAILIISYFWGTNVMYDKIESSEQQKLEELKKFSIMRKNSINDNYSDIEKYNNVEKIFDIGRVEEALGNLHHNFLETYTELSFMSNYEVKINSFEYKLNNFDFKRKNTDTQKQVILSGKILNNTGDIENLFTKFDKFIADTKKNMTDYDVQNNELPRNIDFNQKYFDYPIDLTIISKNEDSKN